MLVVLEHVGFERRSCRLAAAPYLPTFRTDVFQDFQACVCAHMFFLNRYVCRPKTLVCGFIQTKAHSRKIQQIVARVSYASGRRKLRASSDIDFVRSSNENHF